MQEWSVGRFVLNWIEKTVRKKAVDFQRNVILSTKRKYVVPLSLKIGSSGRRMSDCVKTKEELAAEVRRLQNSKVMKEHRAKRKWQRENQ